MRKRKKQHKKSLFQRLKIKGDATILLIIGVAIVAGVMLAGGIFPTVGEDTLNRSGGASQIDESTLPGSDGKESLQLQTFKFKQCSEIAAIEFLIDNSGSMELPRSKLSNLQAALTSFTSQMTDNSVAAMRIFSETTSLVVPFGFYKDNKFQIQTAINSLNPDGGTHTRGAFEQTQNDITAAIGNPSYTKYDFNLIFFSDGIPETLSSNLTCQGLCLTSGGNCRCFDESQNPTDIAGAIKALQNNSGKNVRIFSILLFDPVRDGFAESRFKKMMQDIASPDSYFETTRPEDLKSIFSQISSSVCS